LRRIRVTDTTLRDGSHAVGHSFKAAQAREVSRALDQAGVPVVEVAHGDGLGADSIQCGFLQTPEGELIKESAASCRQASIACMLLPGIGSREDLRRAQAEGARVARIAVLCTEADLCLEHVEAARAMGMEAVAFLMMCHLRSAGFLREKARMIEDGGAECVYLADSAGAMLPDDVRARVGALKDALSIEVGFHGHNNFGLAVGNSVAAIEAGADQIDGSLRGLGAGAGNAPTELLAVVLDRLGFQSNLHLFRLMDAAEFVAAPMMPFQPLPDRDSITLGYAGIYSTFLLHAKQAAARYGLDPRDLVVELGRRQALVGQEDWVEEIAAEMSTEAAGGDRAS
jgi:4-hydroxy 2-oxovalerate aldolase